MTDDEMTDDEMWTVSDDDRGFLTALLAAQEDPDAGWARAS